MSVQPVLMPVPAIGTPRARHLSRHLSTGRRRRLHAINTLRTGEQRSSAGSAPEPRQERPSAVQNARPTGHSRARRGRSCLGPYVSAWINSHIAECARGNGVRRMPSCTRPAASINVRTTRATRSRSDLRRVVHAHMRLRQEPHCVERWIATSRWHIEGEADVHNHHTQADTAHTTPLARGASHGGSWPSRVGGHKPLGEPSRRS